jgi:hypothetical protein
MASKEFVIKKEVALKYLVTYVAPGEDEWLNTLGSLSKRINDKEILREIIAATILLPSLDKSVIPDIPYNLLHWIRKYDQFTKHNWTKKLQAVIKQDETISSQRDKLLVLGCIDPIEYAPYPRQAFRWLTQRSKKSEDFSKEAEEKFRSLVHVYGGVSISNVFKLHDKKLARVPNWRSHYFFERVLHNVYDIDQLVQIKHKEIEQTNSTLIKKL